MRLPNLRTWARAAKHMTFVEIGSYPDGHLEIHPFYTEAAQNEDGDCGLGVQDRIEIANLIEELVNAALESRRKQ